MACGYEALQRAGIPIDKYYASEIDKYAMQIALKNHPDIIEIWDVCEVKWEDYQDIDLLIGGSPCQWFSVAGKMLNFNDPRSKLFFEYVRILKEVKPKYFLLENVKMKKEFRDKISEMMWVEPILIDSARVSAQHRERYYWTNIPWVIQPLDKWILLKDILILDGVEEKYYLTEKQTNKIKELLSLKDIKFHNGESLLEKITFPSRIKQIDWLEIKAPTPPAGMWTGWGNVPCIIQKVWDRDKNNWGVRTDKSYTLPANPMSDRWQMVVKWGMIRKLTPIECERLQTLPDDYTEWVSNTQRYKMLGNWRTVDVIAHIFTFIE